MFLGVFLHDCSAKHPLTRHDIAGGHGEVAAAAAREFLQQHRGTHTLICGCWDETGDPLWLNVRKTRSGKLTVSRADTGPHLLECPFRTAADDCDQFGANTFAEPVHDERTDPPKVWDDGWDWNGSNRMNFTRYARAIISAATCNAYVQANVHSGATVRNPTPTEILNAIRQAIVETQADGKSGYELAQQAGGELRFGIVVDDVRAVLGRGVVMPVFWCTDGEFSLQLVHAPDGATRAGAGMLRGPAGSVNRFPYFVLAVQATTGDRRLQRLFLHPIYADSANMTFVDSNAEAVEAMRLVAQGRSFLKPLRRDHTHLALVGMGVCESTENLWPYRPDFIVFEPNGIRVIEVRGFRLGAVPEYDAHFIRKKLWYEDYLKSCEMFEAVDGWKFSDERPPFELSMWGFNPGFTEFSWAP